MDERGAGDGNVFCYCEWLTREELIAAIPHARDVKELKKNTRVCTVCFGCESDLGDLVDELGHLFGTAPPA